MVIQTLDKDLYLRGKWLGIRKTVEYLSQKQWGQKRKEPKEDSDNQTPNIPNTQNHTKIHRARNTENDYNIEEITIEELKAIINRIKRRKAPGSDEIPMELFKEMNE